MIPSATLHSLNLSYDFTKANSDGWTPASNDKNAGAGKYGSCCNEMDIWEANSVSAAYTP
jgi:cellulose 1,4-beta-cellobiosidase